MATKTVDEDNLPESDKEELRRFSEYLRLVKLKKEGKDLGLTPEQMAEWVKYENGES